MDEQNEQTKSIKSIMILNIIIASVAVVVLGLQIFQVATRLDTSSLEKLQEQLNKIESQQKRTGASTGAQYQQQSSAQTQGGTMPSGGTASQQSGTQKTSGSVAGKCGDGFCGDMEKANPTLCPADCD